MTTSQCVPISLPRLIERLGLLASFGGSVQGGVARQALTVDELAARRWIARTYGTRVGYVVGLDAAANLHIRRIGADAAMPAVMTGSHLDTQPLGGWLDGAFGVMAGLEVLDALDDAGIRTRRTVEVIAWNNEEGSRFSPGLMGSQAYVKPDTLKDYLAYVDADGVSFGSACDRARSDFEQAAGPEAWHLFDARLAQPVHAYVEAHIEQGPVLEQAGAPVGIVTAIQGVRWYEVKVRGRSAHAGTTPLSSRDDAQAKAVMLASALLTYARECEDDALRVTIGRWSCSPDSINTIADEVRFTIDLRHPDPLVMESFDAYLASRLPAGAELKRLQDKPTTAFSPALIQLLRESAQQRRLNALEIVSGAFHDAMPMAGFAPTAMLFAPSIDGVSHHPEENTHHPDLGTCAQVLADSLLRLAEPVT